MQVVDSSLTETTILSFVDEFRHSALANVLSSSELGSSVVAFECGSRGLNMIRANSEQKPCVVRGLHNQRQADD
jgi:hypothetical protein